MKTAYDLLGIRSDADAEAVKKAYRAAVKLHHPDCRPGDPDASLLRFRQIAAAYAILRDAKRRAAYDRRLALGRQTWSEMGGGAENVMHASTRNTCKLASMQKCRREIQGRAAPRQNPHLEQPCNYDNGLQ